VTGQVSTHLPQRVQASSMSAVRMRSACSKAVSFTQKTRFRTAEEFYRFAGRTASAWTCMVAVLNST